MHNWKGKIGLIYISSSTTMEPEFYAMAPKDISTHTARITLPGAEVSMRSLLEMLESEQLEEEAQKLSLAKMNVIIFGCTTGSLLKGLGWDKQLIERIRKATGGIPATTTATAVIEAFRELKVSTLSVATPYPEELNVIEKSFLESNGLKVVNMKGLDLNDDREIAEQSPEVVYKLAREVNRPNADAVFISCTNFRTAEIIDRLERDLKKPVVSSNQASLWAALKIIGVNKPISGYGILLRHLR